MNEGKGKGRAKSNEEAEKEQPSEPQSIISRVAASASGLTRSAFATPNGNELNERAAAVLGEKGQSGQPSKPNSTWAESSQAPHNSQQAGSASAFRASHNEEHVRQSENEFSSFLDGIDSFTPSQDAGEGHFASGALGDEFGDAWNRAQPPPNLPSQMPIYGSVAEQESRDGEDVLALLSQSIHQESTFEPSPEDENYDWGLSTEQRQQLRAMTKDLFPPVESHAPINADHPLNLAPGFDTVSDQSAAARENWREQWDGVLNRYTDEVWGDLLPLVKEARKEVDDLGGESSGTEQTKALRRLGAILGHLRRY